MTTHLIAPQELQALGDDVTIVDCRHNLLDRTAGRNAYAAGHLPSAIFLHLDEDLSGPMNGRNGRHPLPDLLVFAARLAAVGIGPDTRVAAYDQNNGMYAARLWWLLRWIGYRPALVLDGGIDAWTAAGLPLSTVTPQRTPIAAPAQVTPDPQACVDADYVLAHLRDPATPLFDARGADRYRGENETIDPVAGHIPGAISRPFVQNVNAQGRFKPAAQLREEWLQLLTGAMPSSTIQQCGSGVTACHNLLAMEVAGLPGARLYPGSWSEWIADPARPVATGATP